MAQKRKAIHKKVETELLSSSKRRCCLCFGLEQDLEQKEGQIAHIDRNPNNNALENLVWLCLPHHDEYDTLRRQTKSIATGEVIHYRDELYQTLTQLPTTISKDEEADDNPTLSVMHRYSFADDASIKVIVAEILTRIEQIYQFFRLHDCEFKALQNEEMFGQTQQECDARYERLNQEIMEKLKLPAGIWGLHPEGPIPSDWRTSAMRLARNWMSGGLSYKECVDVFWVFDELYDFDLHYILFGIPNNCLTGIQYCALEAFIFQHGQRKMVS